MSTLHHVMNVTTPISTLSRSLVIFTVTITLFSSLGLSPAKGVTDADGTSLVIGMMEPVDSLNPFIGINNNAYVFYSLIYDYLISVDEDLTPKPNLAKSWCVVPDELPLGSVWQYNLTRNAFWHDGEPFSADDVVFTMDYQTGANYNVIWAYQPYTMRIGSTEKVDEYTVRIHFKNFTGAPAPCVFGDSLMMPILPKHIWGDILGLDAQYEEKNAQPIGTGPFMCAPGIADEWDDGSQLTLLRNPDYHGAKDYGQEIAFDKIILKFYLNAEQMAPDLKEGVIDLAQLSPQGYDALMVDLEENPSQDIGSFAGLTCVGDSTVIGVCMLAGGSPGTNNLRLDPAVREAMAYATDKAYIRDEIYSGHAELGYTVFSPMFPDWYWEPTSAEAYQFSISKANQILDAAGYVWKDSTHTQRVASPNNTYAPLDEFGQPNPLSFGVLVESDIPEDRIIAEYLTMEWAKIGIELRVLIFPSDVWNTMIYAGAYDLSITYWSGDPDPNYLLFVQSTAAIGSWSDNWYSSAEYDANYTESLLETNYADRKVHVQNCEKLTYRDLPYIVLTYTYGCFAWRTDHFEGWGDWGAQPGRQLCNYWSANELYFDLKPVRYGGSDNTFLFIGLGAGAIAASSIVGAVFLTRHREKKKAPPAV